MIDIPVAVVTGGAGGLGSAIGRTLASDGFQVVLAGRSLEATQRVADSIGQCASLQPYPGQVDVTDSESVAKLARDIGERFGRLDVLVNNAGTEPSNTLEHTTVADWDRTMDVNVKGAMLMSQAGIPFWRAQGSGSICEHQLEGSSGPRAEPGLRQLEGRGRGAAFIAIALSIPERRAGWVSRSDCPVG